MNSWSRNWNLDSKAPSATEHHLARIFQFSPGLKSPIVLTVRTRKGKIGRFTFEGKELGDKDAEKRKDKAG